MGNSINDAAAKLRALAEALRTDPVGTIIRPEIEKRMRGVSCPDHTEVVVFTKNAQGKDTVESCCGKTADALRKALGKETSPA